MHLKVFGYLDLVAPHKLHDNQADQASFEASHVWKILNEFSLIVDHGLSLGHIIHFMSVLQVNETNKEKTKRNLGRIAKAVTFSFHVMI